MSLYCAELRLTLHAVGNSLLLSTKPTSSSLQDFIHLKPWEHANLGFELLQMGQI